MADQKLSALTTGSAIAATDLFYSGQDAGGGVFNSVKQPFSAIRTGLNVRTLLTANANYYVDGVGGNDGNTGAIGSKWATLQHAVDVIVATLDFGGFTVIINVADATYTGGIVIGSWVGGGTLLFLGNTGTPANVFLNVTGVVLNISGTLGGILAMTGFKIAGTVIGLFHNGGGKFQLNALEFGNCGTAHVVSATGIAIVEATGNYTVTGNATYHWLVNGGGQLNNNGLSGITITGTPVISVWVLVGAISFLGAFTSGTVTFTGAPAAGTQKYSVTGNGVIDTNGSGPSFFPGTVAGTATNGGQYL